MRLSNNFFGHLTKIFWKGCQNCILRVQTNYFKSLNILVQKWTNFGNDMNTNGNHRVKKTDQLNGWVSFHILNMGRKKNSSLTYFEVTWIEIKLPGGKCTRCKTNKSKILSDWTINAQEIGGFSNIYEMSWRMLEKKPNNQQRVLELAADGGTGATTRRCWFNCCNFTRFFFHFAHQAKGLCLHKHKLPLQDSLTTEFKRKDVNSISWVNISQRRFQLGVEMNLIERNK